MWMPQGYKRLTKIRRQHVIFGALLVNVIIVVKIEWHSLQKIREDQKQKGTLNGYKWFVSASGTLILTVT